MRMRWRWYSHKIVDKRVGGFALWNGMYERGRVCVVESIVRDACARIDSNRRREIETGERAR